ncbi:hydroxymethylpyrimidine/phosphomethylpyrimidine kinase [uncultured Massilia sp.]|uniref:bifunctional hydroxymethylpyrimidine kinase/phosphomethylpyrimidine kinase n=1 Tax=uncultured Massilia sp. TaxID=169973 RepID=UPI0025E923ED|nr:hydroxymethylpyrimidine/phosphomethylpyrimidine kinase [uncultured Massilia sp.]
MAALAPSLRPPVRPCVLVFAGLDPSGGAGIQADIEAIAAQGAHALPVVTALTVQDNDRVHAIEAVSDLVLRCQAGALLERMAIGAVKVGIPGNLANARAIADVVRQLRETQPALPVVVDPVLASGHGDRLADGDAAAILAPLLAVATVLVPNLPEAAALGARLAGCPHVLVTGGHGGGHEVVNRWTSAAGERAWRWPRLPGEFHGSGCTLASSIAARLALGEPMAQALEKGQRYCNQALADAYAIAPGQRIPRRIHP